MFSRIIIVFIVSFVGFGVAAGQTGSVQISEASLAELFKKSQNIQPISIKHQTDHDNETDQGGIFHELVTWLTA